MTLIKLISIINPKLNALEVLNLKFIKINKIN